MKAFTVRVEDDTMEWLKHLAKQKGRSLSAQVNQLIRQAQQKEQQTKESPSR
jgi:predicted transcriptional regulator